MEFNVTNHQLCVGDIHITGVASSALFLIGDVQTIQLSSAFDTPRNLLSSDHSFRLLQKDKRHVFKNIKSKVHFFQGVNIQFHHANRRLFLY